MNDKFYEKFNIDNEPNNFSHAVTFMNFKHDLKYLIDIELGQLGTNAFFTLSDIRKLCGRMQIYFDDMLENMLEKQKEENRPFYEKIHEEKGIEAANDWLKHIGFGQINLIKDIISSQVDTVSLGILFRTHSFLENILKELCDIIKRGFSLEKSYGDIGNSKISTFEKCVKYLLESPLDNISDERLFKILKAWNSVRNNLIHSNGVVSSQNKRLVNAIKVIGLKTSIKRSGTITMENGDLNTAKQVIIERTLIQLDFAKISEYVELIDKYLALLLDKNALNN